MFTQRRMNPTIVPLHTRSLFLDPLGESLPGSVITHSFLFSLRSIGMATLAEPHSYSFPMLVIGLSHEATARSPPTTSVCFLSLRLYYSLTRTECTHANGGRKGSVEWTRVSIYRAASFKDPVLQVGWVCMHLSLFRSAEGIVFFLISPHLQLLYGKTCLARGAVASHSHRFWQARVATAAISSQQRCPIRPERLCHFFSVAFSCRSVCGPAFWQHLSSFAVSIT